MKFREDVFFWFFRKAFVFLTLALGFYIAKIILFSAISPGVVVLFNVVLVLFFIWDFLKNIVFQSWNITGEQLISKNGIVFQDTNYLELYRVYDYAVKKTVFQQIFSVCDVIIHSTDKTDRILVMKNVSTKIDIVNELRQKVESLKLNRRILEVAND